MGAVTGTAFGRLFNSPLEAGTRAVVVLENLRPEVVDLGQMVLLDHAVVHTADFGGPDSLHPDLHGRIGEIVVRRQVVEAGLDLMRRCHLVDVTPGESGFLYGASPEAAAYVELLETPYSVLLRRCADWVADLFRGRTATAFDNLIRERLGDWGEGVGDLGRPS